MAPIDEGTTMPTFCRSYATEADAHAAVLRLLGAGVPEAGIRVLMGEQTRDAAAAPVGEFAGAAGPQVGAFAGAPHVHAEGMGGFAGEPAETRQGGFADRDRDTITSFSGSVERVRAASHGALRKLLVEAGIDERAAGTDVEALHAGRVLVLATPGDASAEAATRALDAA